MAGDHKCPVCASTFTRPQHVARHMRSHTGDRPYKCVHCGDQFARSDLLSRHVNKCHAAQKPPTTTQPARRKGHALPRPAPAPGLRGPALPLNPPPAPRKICAPCARARSPAQCDSGVPCGSCLQRNTACSYSPPRPPVPVPSMPAPLFPSQPDFSFSVPLYPPPPAPAPYPPAPAYPAPAPPFPDLASFLYAPAPAPAPALPPHLDPTALFHADAALYAPAPAPAPAPAFAPPPPPPPAAADRAVSSAFGRLSLDDPALAAEMSAASSFFAPAPPARKENLGELRDFWKAFMRDTPPAAPRRALAKIASLPDIKTPGAGAAQDDGAAPEDLRLYERAVRARAAEPVALVLPAARPAFKRLASQTIGPAESKTARRASGG